MVENLNITVIEQLTEALAQTRAQLNDMETEHNRLRAQVSAYEQSIRNLKALESGNFAGLMNNSSNPAPVVRKDSYSLKESIHEYFKSHPRMTQTPKGLSKWLTEEKGWPEDTLRARVSNMLRKIEKEESWLTKAGHGKYQYVAAN